jgi:mRNA-degrading endonuclease toxin of MazEF toxin-antitoxin module
MITTDPSRWRQRMWLVEQITLVDPQRLGRSAGRLEAAELVAVDEALALVLGV